jgi:hypothetical protein
MHIDVIMASMYLEIQERRCAYTQPDKTGGENVPMPDWNRQARNRDARLERAAHLTSTKLVPTSDVRALLEAVLEPFLHVESLGAEDRRRREQGDSI